VRCMRGRSKLRAKASRFAAYGAFVAETVGAPLATSTAALSALTFLLVLAFPPAGGPVSGLPVLLLLTSVGYSVVALAGASAMVSDLKGPAQVFLSQPISRTAYALAWLSALLTSALATFSAFLLSFAVIDPILLRAVDPILAAAWLLDAAILALALLAAAVLARRAAVLVAVWAAMTFGSTFLLALPSEHLRRAVAVARPLYGALSGWGAAGGPPLAESALLAAALALLLYWLARARLEV